MALLRAVEGEAVIKLEWIPMGVGVCEAVCRGGGYLKLRAMSSGHWFAMLYTKRDGWQDRSGVAEGGCLVRAMAAAEEEVKAWLVRLELQQMAKERR